MMSLVVDQLINLLAAAPDAVLAAGHIGDHVPATSGDLPGISVSLVLDPPRGNGIGQFVREGHQLVQNTAVIEVAVTADTFTADLKTLRILPLPLKRNPSSHTANFSEADIGVRRVTDPSNPVSYRLSGHPAVREEFALDVTSALLRFGAPQIAGDKLEVVHWTLEFRDDIVSVRYSGLVNLDVWGKDTAETSTLARGVQSKLAGARDILRAQGFVNFSPAALGAATSILQQPGTGSSFGTWRQTLTYKFAFEGELGGETSAGGAIRRIDVDASSPVPEPFTIPALV